MLRLCLRLCLPGPSLLLAVLTVALVASAVGRADDDVPPESGAGEEAAAPMTAEELAALEAYLTGDDEDGDDGDGGDDARDDDAHDTGQTLIGSRRRASRVVGSAHVVDRETLERFEADDLHRVLREVPGVYVRDEDGVGLRPNIGIRGASSDRSAKVTLLEDGVLFGPAPYAAPAAYFFPLQTRLVGVEVWKGPAAIRQGPHTIGGALNLRTRPVPSTPAGGVDVGFGLVGPGREQSRVHAHAGTSFALPGALRWLEAGVLAEAARVQSDGFKIIDGDRDADTGFVRDDVMLKAQIGTPITSSLHQRLELKLGLQREESRETYLGLTDADFRADPNRRYAASASDLMQWVRTQAQLRYRIESDVGDLDVVAYRHDLDRTWNKVNGVRGAPNLHDVLGFGTVGQNAIFADRLKSQAELPTDDIAVLIGPNHRRYASHGVAVTGAVPFDLQLTDDGLMLSQRLEGGVRLHQDTIDRDHRERGFHVVGDALVSDGTPEVQTALNRASASALSAFVVDELRLGPVMFVPGVRLEYIAGTFEDRRAGADAAAVASEQVAVLPGVGLAYSPITALTFIGGVHRGFSPIAPGQSADVRPEESTNTELGLRFDLTRALGLSGEAIGFVSLYDNIVGECTFSAGCVDDIGVQTNGGSALVSGLEVLVRERVPLRLLRPTDHLRIDVAGTYTNAQFATSFRSNHPLFGDVQAGDFMAYVPTIQGSATVALVMGPLDVGLSLGHIGAMRDVPGQEETIPEHARLDAQTVVDVAGTVELMPALRLGVRLDNVFDQRALVSRRPFGARPSKPRTLLVSIEADFD